MKIVSNGKTLEVGGGAAQEIYDGEERVIGTWFGKPLYRKVMQITLSQEIVSYFPLSADIMFRRGELYIGSATGQKDVLPGTFQVIALEPSNYVSWFYDKASNRFTVWADKCRGFSAYIILEYTKTTDATTIELPTALSTPVEDDSPFTYNTGLDDIPVAAATAPDLEEV